MLECDHLVVGAGFAGAVIAERLASQLGRKIIVIDRRPHLAGNAYDFYDQAGVMLHAYGPHYFRTNSEEVIRYLSQFTDWLPAEYRILTLVDGQLWPFPINLNTFEKILGRDSTTEEMIQTLAKWRVPIHSPSNSEEKIVSQIGFKLYEKFYKNYTQKQWDRHPRDLDASVCGRIPIRTNRDNRYFEDKFQALPSHGYTAMFQRIISHPNITVMLNTEYEEIRPHIKPCHLIYSGRVDEYFAEKLGVLPYRSMRFEPETLDCEFFQPTVQVNYPNDEAFTRVVELKHITGQILPKTTIVREYPEAFSSGKVAYYPIPSPQSKKLALQYQELARNERNVLFLGRLGRYQYYNMDQVVAQALSEFRHLANHTLGIKLKEE